MKRATTTEEELILASCREARPSLLRHSIVWLSIPLTGALALVDAQALQAVAGGNAGWQVYGVYTFPLLTLVSMVGMWSALGREAWWTRLGILSLSLPAVGFVIGLSAKSARSSWNNLFYSWRGGANGEIELGIVWTVLAGTLLAGLLVVFRSSANRLQRRVAG